MEWRLFATLAETVGRDRVDVSVDGDATVRDAFDALLAAHPDLADAVLAAEGDAELADKGGEQLADHVRLLHEGRDPFAEADGWETPVGADDELGLFPPVSGG